MTPVQVTNTTLDDEGIIAIKVYKSAVQPLRTAFNMDSEGLKVFLATLYPKKSSAISTTQKITLLFFAATMLLHMDGFHSQSPSRNQAVLTPESSIEGKLKKW
jgi:hypothetical protein